VPDPRDPAIPVIDLSAGPGGLGEGFSRYATNNRPAFRIALSVKTNAAARRNLTARHVDSTRSMCF
jgi:hypothetical protein